jgi:hypothetical protein
MQLDHQGRIIKLWESATDASRALNIGRTGITSCCTGYFKTAGGYHWQYKD